MLNDESEFKNKVQISLSIIVPIYNAEQYLSLCIDSILSQELTEYELILVNDGSKDKSGKICEEYRKQYSNIIYICQENAGVVNARIAGIKAAKGQYIGFVDADDWIDKDYFQRMLKVAREYSLDVVCSKYLESNEINELEAPDQHASGYYSGKKLDQLKQNMMYKRPFYSFGIYPSLWSKIIKREYLVKWQMKVPQSITLGEDAAVFYPLMLKECRNVYIINENHGYHYRQTPDSMVHKFNRKLSKNVMELMTYFDQIFENEDKSFLKQKRFYYFMLIKWCIGNELNSRERTRQIISNIKIFRHFKSVSETFEKGTFRGIPLACQIFFYLYKKEKYYCLVYLSKFYQFIERN